MNKAIKLMPEHVRSVDAATIAGAGAGVYTSISIANPALDHPARMILLQNFTNADLMISMDGINEDYPIASRSSIILDITTNRSSTGGIYCIAQGTRFYVTQLEVPTTGSIYLTSFYASED